MNMLFKAPAEEKPLRPYQIGAINRLFEEIRAGRKPVCMAPTGAGKGRIIAELVKIGQRKGRRVAVCAPMLSLIGQTWRVLADEGIPEIDMGVIQADNPLANAAAAVQICSVDTLVRRRSLPEVDLVIIDECHRFTKLVPRWMEEAPQTKFIGFSATPWRADMHKEWDSMVVAATMKELIDEGFLSPYRAFAPSSPDLSEVKIVAGDYHEGQLSEVMQKPKLIADVVNTWREKAGGRPTLVFAVDCAHARLLQEQFHGTGSSAGYCDAYTPVEGKDGREEMLAKLRTGELNVICNVGTLTTGVDAPFVSCIQLARPTRSEMLYIQIVGRGLRNAEGKQDCLILDHSDTIKRLGFPDDIHYDDFVRKNAAREDKEKQERLPKPCPQCSYLLMPGVRECPSCGFVKAAPSSRIIHEDGSLEEVTRGAPKKQKQLPLEDRRRWHAALHALALEYGKSHKWVSAHYKEKFGEWPPRYFTATPGPVDAHIRSWVHSRRIAYAKAMAKKKALQNDVQHM